ncbi:cytochrome o ubiquinol oxidase subunit III [Gluconacetobacter entanii]|uniref:Cytochrome bo(3) ubiquinol oxidase subunit 3 n=1 Tax=Gluconacetobacter entanii TaxID=108528 RepID=A0ABT3K9A1_9PROT|nr:cytochrome o ubiquinol oxidase subunit III [Gluconacetobacter entanii]MBE7620032.1 cytochrome o ubiquinol oxidase subunit III [Komagataeibacter sp. FXV2]MCE2579952.1 cytochrome o ubiquinol oxidase subunit III [Komagataeibacter sp. FNDCR1]MBY4639379.1 cytochrome o ubiquinol oxidase subunit III [Gluconacetobacter entanii]MCW4582153.1 cytochrome o ubiquinol oxidase subunit III [Gluconacetobacter entanii]MCW4585488.1 cytochrome o ubiquinol oxidase subunit III [Gluconacetobacter entanii]
MAQNITADAAHAHEEHHESPVVFGFWLYLMTDCIIFGTLFAVFAVLRTQFNGGPNGHEVFELSGVGIETAILLFSSITYGFGMIAAHENKISTMRVWLGVTFLLGLGFLFMEIREFTHMIAEGNGPDRSAFLSSFFTLVGTHGLHVTCGLLWMAVLLFQTAGKTELNERMIGKLTCLSLFWHFLDIVWICVFTFVYLMSVV